MAAKGDATAGARPGRGETRSRRAALSPELIAIVAVGVTLAGVMLTMMTVMTDSFARELGAVREEVREVRDEVRVVRDGQVELRERVTRVESKLDVLAGGWPPKRDSGTVE